MSVSRGVIIGPRMKKLDGGGVEIESSAINPADLRRYVLYWDQIDWPDNNVVSLGADYDPPDIATLRAEGILRRSEVRLPSWNGPIDDLFALAQEAAFLHNSRSGENIGWAIAQTAPALVLPGARDTRRSIEVDLTQTVLSPAEDVPIDRVLEFRRRREAELLQFRNAIDELYLEAVSSGDVHRARELALRKLRRSINDLDRVMSEPGWKRVISSMKASFSVTDGIAAGWGMTAAISEMASVGNDLLFNVGLITALGSAVKISVVSLPKFRATIPEQLTPFAYVHHVEKELGPTR